MPDMKTLTIGGTTYTIVDEVARNERSTATNMTNSGTGVVSTGDITDGSGNVLSDKLDASKFVFEQSVQLDGGSTTLSAGTSWTQPYTASGKIITVPAGKYIVTVSARYSGLTSGNQYGVGIAYNTGSGWTTYTRGRQSIRVYGTVVHQFSGASTCSFSSQTTLTVSTYHQAAATLTDCVIGVIGLAN